MHRYLVFAGDAYYPLGGMNDFICDFGALDAAISCAKTHYHGKGSGTWSNVYDIQERKEVWCYYMDGQ